MSSQPPGIWRIFSLVVGLMLSLAVVVNVLADETPPPSATTQPVIDWDKARKLHQREVQNQPLTADEQAYLDRAKAAMQSGHGPGQNGGGGGNAAGVKPPPPPRQSTGLIPLPDLTGKYKDQDGGLYGQGRNQIPEPQKTVALNASVVPLDIDGTPAADGKIVLLSIGMSNTTMEFGVFKRIADQDPRKNPKLVIVDAAQGGKDANAWVDPNSRENVWQTADARTKERGVTDAQVEVVWIKQAMMGPSRLGEFPKHADVLRDDLIQILKLARERYPNLKLAYLSSRIYAGYATTGLNPEPYAYEGAFAVRDVIEMQMKGDGGLSAAEGKMPVVLWGPYLWTDGIKGRKTDNVVWTRQDVGQDGTHPSPDGQRKVADMLLKFFTTDQTAMKWFVNPAAGK